jgi:hypothetical protein
MERSDRMVEFRGHNPIANIHKTLYLQRPIPVRTTAYTAKESIGILYFDYPLSINRVLAHAELGCTVSLARITNRLSTSHWASARTRPSLSRKFCPRSRHSIFGGTSFSCV